MKPQTSISEARREIERMILDIPGFMSCTFVHLSPDANGHTKTSIRTIETKEGSAFQVTQTGGLSANTFNIQRTKCRNFISEMINASVETHVSSASADYHLRITKKGRPLVSRSKPLNREQAPAAHDRVKDYPLSHIDEKPLLRVLGFSDSQDRMLPSMHAKYRQVNEFLRVLDAVVPQNEDGAKGKPLTLVDVGCGKAYLSFCARAYLAETRNADVRLIGVDRREDIIASCKSAAERLGLDPSNCEFASCDIRSFKPSSQPDIVLSLHACDNATDETIACGIEWGAKAVLSAPCCQHEIQKTLPNDGPNQALLRHGILRERISDILADAFRAQILRIAGYRVKVIEFVEPEATGRNIMIRAERGVRPGADLAVSEYLAMRDSWRVTPYLEERLRGFLEPFGIIAQNFSASDRKASPL